MDPLVRYEVRAAVAVLTLNRPERHNAWTFELEQELFDAPAGTCPRRCWRPGGSRTSPPAGPTSPRERGLSWRNDPRNSRRCPSAPRSSRT